MTHYFDAEQDSPLRAQEISFTVRQRRFVAKTGSGVFSKDGLDNATALLIESCELRGDERVLDLGCGWGAVGMVIGSLYPKASVVMSDVNQRAVQLARLNAPGADIRISDGFEGIPERFDIILTNPPYAAGREACYGFIEGSYEHLVANGRLLLVARHQKGGRMLEQKIKDVFGNVETLKKGGGFRVYVGRRER